MRLEAVLNNTQLEEKHIPDRLFKVWNLPQAELLEKLSEEERKKKPIKDTTKKEDKNKSKNRKNPKGTVLIFTTFNRSISKRVSILNHFFRNIQSLLKDKSNRI